MSEPEKNGVDAFQDFLDVGDFLRAEIKEEINERLLAKISEKAGLIRGIVLSAKRPKDAAKAEERISSLVLPSAKTICERYAESSGRIGEDLAKHVVSRTPNARGSRKSEYDFFEISKRILRRVLEGMVMDTRSYVVDMTGMLWNFIRGGMSRESAGERIENEVARRAGSTGRYFNAISARSESYVFRVADAAMRRAFEFNDIAGSMTWTTFFTKSCPDCIDRHGITKTYSEWEREGLPRSGATVCREHCHCVLLPEGYSPRISAPVRRRESALLPRM